MSMSNWKWADRFLKVAYEIASWSKDPSTKVGCVVVGTGRQILATGYNGLPRGVLDDPQRMERPQKYLWTTHAEANALAQAARHGIRLEGATVYTTHCPCAQCAGLIIAAGAKCVIVDQTRTTNMDLEHFEVAERMFREAGVEFIKYQATWNEE